jgi:hypothetical protein
MKPTAMGRIAPTDELPNQACHDDHGTPPLPRDVLR